jgi:hypothetical protein
MVAGRDFAGDYFGEEMSEPAKRVLRDFANARAWEDAVRAVEALRRFTEEQWQNVTCKRRRHHLQARRQTLVRGPHDQR